MSHRRQYSLLIVRGDGVRVLRFNFPRRLAIATLAALVGASLLLAGLLGDWWSLRGRVRDAAALYQELAEQRSTIDGFNRRVADLRREVAGWREMHARIWEPFGPDASPKSRGTGIGGGTLATSDRPARSSVADELNRLAESVAEEGESLRSLESMITRASRAIAALPSRWPVRGAVNSEFGARPSPWARGPERHSGIDIGAERGTVVLAPSAGTVSFAGTHAEYGLAVMLDHGHDLKTLYGHLSRITVTLGQQVARGGEIGLTGNTGRSSGPHLHYEILLRNQPVNPRGFLWE
ncbi:MAG: M23 family metallopeptidase [Candidatus Rokubacteria bacterium]|nr:M23 family metallopeptidase [Candidatus Rokubacteria bacterium]MBI3825307.1 M23 family metallopeptidase [Candidatus Rokubacteria bacterium]